LPLEDAAELRTITLGGFKMTDLNEEYLEGPGEPFRMQGRETYWQASGKYFIFFCRRFSKWRIAAISAFGQNKDGNCLSFVSDNFPGRDIRSASLTKGWNEVEGEQWVYREEAGVVDVGTLGDQMDREVPAGDAEQEDAEPSKRDAADAEETSKCPVTRGVRKAKAKFVEATKAAGKWVRRLFPKLLSAPHEEDLVPPPGEGGPEEAAAAAMPCDPDTQEGCSFRQKFYIEKQRGATVEGRRQELARLQKMQGAVMKPEQMDWLMSRVDILGKMAKKEDGEEGSALRRVDAEVPKAK
jgi:hypothetical protein